MDDNGYVNLRIEKVPMEQEEEKKLLTKMDVNKDGSVTPIEQENYYNKNKTKK